jgi:arylsulfatase A-like enzyme
VITSSQGEEFYEAHPDDPGGDAHGRTLYREQTQVPLILSIPNLKPKRPVVDAPVELVDLVPTILDSLGVDLKKFSQFQGQSLVRTIKTGKSKPRPVYAGGAHGRGMIIDGEWKYYRSDRNKKAKRKRNFKRPKENEDYEMVEELYNLKADPAETTNLAAKHPDILEKLRRMLNDKVAKSTPQTPSPGE